MWLTADFNWNLFRLKYKATYGGIQNGKFWKIFPRLFLFLLISLIAIWFLYILFSQRTLKKTKREINHFWNLWRFNFKRVKNLKNSKFTFSISFYCKMAIAGCFFFVDFSMYCSVRSYLVVTLLHVYIDGINMFSLALTIF